jgi:hypothetical protein
LKLKAIALKPELDIGLSIFSLEIFAAGHVFKDAEEKLNTKQGLNLFAAPLF